MTPSVNDNTVNEVEDDIPDWVTADGDFSPEFDNVLELPPAKRVDLPEAPQQAERAEKIIVGNLLIGFWSPTLSTLQNLAPKMYDPVRKCIVETCVMLSEGGHDVDGIHVWAMLEHKPGLSMAISLEGLSAMSDEARVGHSAPREMDGLLAQVNEAWQRRELLSAISEARESIVSGSELPGVLDSLGMAQAAVRQGYGCAYTTPAEALGRAQAEMHASARDGFSPYRTGVAALDEILRIIPGELVVIAARPSVGKSAIALQIAHIAADPENECPCDVYYISKEMSDTQLVKRCVSSYSQVRVNEMNMPSRDVLLRIEKDFVAAGKKIARFNIRYHAGGFSPFDIEQGVRSWHGDPKARKNKRALCLVDYLQILKILTSKGMTRDQAIGTVTIALKELAMDLKMPVILLSQLNRQVEGRDSPQPRMSDLRESGNIENDSDTIVGLSRPFMSLNEGVRATISQCIGRGIGWEGKTYEELKALESEVQANIIKQRNFGNMGKWVSMMFDGSHQKFTGAR